MEPKAPPDGEPVPPVTDEWGLPVPERVDQPVDVELGCTTPDEPEAAW